MELLNHTSSINALNRMFNFLSLFKFIFFFLISLIYDPMIFEGEFFFVIYGSSYKSGFVYF